MNNPSSTPEPYPIEIQCPDITPYAAGNRGIPYVFTFDSERPGPHVMVNALMHGNEICGAIVVRELLERQLRPRCGRLTLAFANVDAYHGFRRDRPDAARFVDQDMNRVWSEAVLDDPSQDSRELRRARRLRPVIDSVDLLLDLHSMHEKSAPLILSGPLEKGMAFARQLKSSATIIVDEGHKAGRRLRDYAAFSDPHSSRNALLVECGQHWESAVVPTAREITYRFLLTTGIVNREDLPAGIEMTGDAESPVVEVTHAVVAGNIDFRFAEAYKGLETIPTAGTVIAWDGEQAVRTPYPNCVLVMPSLRQLRPGVTVVRFGKQNQWESK